MASLRLRIGGYVVDMVIFAAVAMVMFVLAGTQLLLVTRGATRDASDPTLYGFLAIIGLGVPSAWTALSLLVLLKRHQTPGQYVAGLRVAREDGAPLSRRDILTWWFCLNPTLFSWPMAIVTGFPLAGVLSLLLSRATIAVFGALVVLCVLAPLAALFAAATDGRRRGLHDRIAGTIVVPAE